jgi:hypothetical protein
MLHYMEAQSEMQVNNYFSRLSLSHVKEFPCHHCMARPQFADEGDGLQI